jgi:AraC family transcriptional regulator
VANQISEYVQAHLDEEIVLDDLALRVGISKFHLNRVFHATTGFQLGEFIQRRRMQTAYALLATDNTSVIEASLAAGYQSHSGFSRAFLSAFGCTPNDVKRGSDCVWRTPNTIKKAQDSVVALLPEILMLPTQHFRGLYGTGFKNSSFVELGNSLSMQLAKVLRDAGLGNLYAAPIGVSLETPWQGDQGKSRFFLGIAAAGLPMTLPSAEFPLAEFIWQQGTWAKFHHQGSYSLMWQTISRVYATWIVPEQIRLRDHNIVQVYLNNPSTTAETDLITAMYFPIDIN